MKIIASDFDGTFSRPENKGILESDIAAVKRWQAAGNLFGFSTGRALKSIRKIAAQIGVDFIVTAGGAAVYTGQGELIWENTVTLDDLIIALDIARTTTDMGYVDAFYGKREWCLRDRYLDYPFPEDIEKLHVVAFSCASPEWARRLSLSLREALGDRVNPQLNYMNVDMVAPGISKTEGILQYLKTIGGRPEDVITVGDHYNDYTMIRDFYGVTVEGGIDEIKAIAHKVYRDFTELVDDYI